MSLRLGDTAPDFEQDSSEGPISFREREHGHSKISRRIVVEALWLVTVWGAKARLGVRPRAG